MTHAAHAIALSVTLCGVAADSIHAQDFPTRPVSIVVGFSAGGANDTVARIVAAKLTESWAQPVAVVNRPGAGGTTAAAQVVRRNPMATRCMPANSGPSPPPAASMRIHPTTRSGTLPMSR